MSLRIGSILGCPNVIKHNPEQIMQAHCIEYLLNIIFYVGYYYPTIANVI
jgi:hypothetical protein